MENALNKLAKPGISFKIKNNAVFVYRNYQAVLMATFDKDDGLDWVKEIVQDYLKE